jgi:hypothetical protein
MNIQMIEQSTTLAFETFEVVWSRVLPFKSLMHGVILFSNAILFDGLTIWIGIYFAFIKGSFECHANTSSIMCMSNNMGLVISSF